MMFSEAQVRNFGSMDEAQRWILASILESGGESSPRGMRTLELYPVTFNLLNPRSRCVINPRRRWSLPLALGEFCWHLSGSNELQFIEYYAPRWREFAEDTIITGSCYGHRIFKREPGRPSQWERLIQLLRSDPDSRRALLLFSDPVAGLNPEAKDVACASTLQFMIRSGRVHAFVHMRSNDAIWGLPYDIFLFTMLQELLACELNLELGVYSHSVTSIHLYERHFGLAQKIVEGGEAAFFEMPPMKKHRQLEVFLKLEAELRAGKSVNGSEVKFLDAYWRDLLSVLEWYGLVKDAGGYSNVRDVGNDSPYAKLLDNLSAGRGMQPTAV
jgi:thymidylate synthase